MAHRCCGRALPRGTTHPLTRLSAPLSRPVQALTTREGPVKVLWQHRVGAIWAKHTALQHTANGDVMSATTPLAPMPMLLEFARGSVLRDVAVSAARSRLFRIAMSPQQRMHLGDVLVAADAVHQQHRWLAERFKDLRTHVQVILKVNPSDAAAACRLLRPTACTRTAGLCSNRAGQASTDQRLIWRNTRRLP